MTVLLSPVGGVAGQFFDNNGNPLTGGKIYTYAAGTTTPQATYTTGNGTVAHSNPIILDAGGRVPSGEIWLTDGYSYKFVLKNATDVLIGTYDSIVGINSNFVNFLATEEIQTATAGQTVFTLVTTTYQPGTNSLSVFVDGVNQYDGSSYAYVETNSTTVTFTAGLHVGALVKFTTVQTQSAGATDASQVSYTPAGTGAVPTNVQAKLRESVSVLDFGADPTGVTDSTDEIQAAHTYSIANGFPHIVFPTGTYKFTTLTWSPHVGARTTGKVYLQTAIASGRAIQVSDEYGLPSPYGLNSIKNIIWSGQFYLVNTNGANTATAWAFGGATVANYCGWSTALTGVETRGFHGKVYEFRNNCALIDFQQCFNESNNGSQVYTADPTTNSGEGIRFFGCIFGSGTGYLVDINSVHIWSVDFIGCSCDYLLGMNKPGNSAPLTAINWSGGHLEWSQVTYPYLQNDAAMTWNIDGAMVAPTALSGWPNPLVSKTTRINASVNGTTRFTNIKYVIPGTTPALHEIADVTSRGVFDYTPNYQNGNVPPQFVAPALGSVVGFDGITYQQQVGDSSVIWSGTIGDGSKTYTWTRIGNRVDVWLQIVWGSTTSHPASQQTISLPFAANSLAGGFGSGWINDFGTGNRLVVGKVAASATAIIFYDVATDAILSNVVPITWAVGDVLQCHVTYFTETP